MKWSFELKSFFPQHIGQNGRTLRHVPKAVEWARKIRSDIAKEGNKKLTPQLVRVKILGNKIAIIKDAVSPNFNF